MVLSLSKEEAAEGHQARRDVSWFLSLMIDVFERQSHRKNMRGRYIDLPPAVPFPRWQRQLGLGQAEAEHLGVHLRLPRGSQGRRHWDSLLLLSRVHQQIAESEAQQPRFASLFILDVSVTGNTLHLLRHNAGPEMYLVWGERLNSNRVHPNHFLQDCNLESASILNTDVPHLIMVLCPMRPILN